MSATKSGEKGLSIHPQYQSEAYDIQQILLIFVRAIAKFSMILQHFDFFLSQWLIVKSNTPETFPKCQVQKRLESQEYKLVAI